jgi:cytochrome P450
MLPKYPGPFRNWRRVRRDAIGFLSDVVRDCGDFARFDVMTVPFVLVNDPALIREALVDHSEELIIRGGASAGLARLIGHGILTNHGDAWRKSRAGLQPMFHQNLIDAAEAAIEARVQETLERWRALPMPFALNRELLALSYRIKASALFRSTPEFDEALEFADAIWTLQLDGLQRFMDGADFTPWIPSPRNRRVNAARAALWRIGRGLIERGADQPLDEVLSILFAGAESPVNTLCFALRQLEHHPEWRDDPRVLDEALRLYPAGWAFERWASKEVTLGGEKIEKGWRLLFSPFLLHRNPKHWTDPERFDPARPMVKQAYLPFGAGPRSCIGGRLAMAEMRIALRMIAEQCDWTTHSAPDPGGAFKLRLTEPLMVTMRVRASRSPTRAALPT